jgi:hypothetical protein
MAGSNDRESKNLSSKHPTIGRSEAPNAITPSQVVRNLNLNFNTIQLQTHRLDSMAGSSLLALGGTGPTTTNACPQMMPIISCLRSDGSDKKVRIITLMMVGTSSRSLDGARRLCQPVGDTIINSRGVTCPRLQSSQGHLIGQVQAQADGQS